MPTEVIVSLISSIIGGLLVAVVNHVFTRRKVAAETEKLRAEAEKLRAEATKMNAEAEGIKAKTITEFYKSLIEKGQWGLLALQLSDRPEDMRTVVKTLRQDRETEMKHQLETLKVLLEADALEAYQLEEASKRVLERFVESFKPQES